MKRDEIENIIGNYLGDETSLIEILQDIQLRYNYLPKDALYMVSDGLSLPLSKVYSVATFYKAFSLNPRGKKCIRVCMGTACHVRGAKLIKEELETRLGIKTGSTTTDLEYTLEAVNCVGACALAPVVMVNEDYMGNMGTGKIRKILSQGREKS